MSKSKISYKHNLIRKHKELIVVIFFLLFSPLFFYNLGGTSLVDFDEAWYAEIARNILVNHQPFLLSFNGAPYTDHPPLGFILITLSFLTFGISEFSARLPSAILGFASVIVTYFIGKNLFNRAVGVGAGLMLVSSAWFILRARSGNLDSIFLFFYLLSFYFAIKVKQNYKYLYLLSASFALVLLTKSVIGITVLIPITAVLYINRIVPKIKVVINSVVVFLIIFTPWLLINYQFYGLGFTSHMLSVGLRHEHRMTPNLLEIGRSLTMQYLHFGIREWYYPALIALLGSFFFILKKHLLIPIFLWIIVLLWGFLSNSKTEIWHLIPLYPIFGLLIAFFFYESIFFILKRIKLKKKFSTNISSLLVIIFLLGLSLKQVYEFRNEIKLFDHDVGGLAYTAKAARNYSEKLYLDGEFFFPGATFYSQKTVFLVKSQGPPQDSLKGIVSYGKKPFLLLTEQWRLDQDGIDNAKYDLFSEHKGYVLIRVNN